MIPVTSYAGMEVAVFGLGRTGVSAARALMKGGAKVHAWDDNEATREKAAEAGVTIRDINKMDWQNFAALVLSPGVPYRFPEPHRVVKMAQMVDVPVIGDMELFARAVGDLPEHARPRIVGVTGTNGKSTTTALIGHILKEAGKDMRVGGNIGVGVLDLEALTGNSIYVLELSSYQLDLVETLRCDVAVFLNVSADHLDRHGGMEGYVAAKKQIFDNQTADDTAVIGVDDLYSQLICTKLAAQKMSRVMPISSEFALGRGVSVLNNKLSDCRAGRVAESFDMSAARALPGSHNHQNAAAAYAACQALGVAPQDIMRAMASFPGLPHRLESVCTIGGVTFINDSKATNAQAAEQAIKAYPNAYWIVGGRPKDDGLEGMAEYFPLIGKAFLIGEAAKEFARRLEGEVDLEVCGTLDVAVRAAYDQACESGDPDPVVLFSPACASFDQFRDFEARGDTFKALVKALDVSTRGALRALA